MEHHAGLARLVEVQSVPGHRVEQVVDRQSTKIVGLEVVGGDEMLLHALLGEEPPACAVIAAVGEELQGQERVGGPALAQVELDRVRRPRAGLRP